MTPLEALLATRDLLSVPERWTKGSNARDAEGRPCSTISPLAVRWCLQGAMMKVTGDNRELWFPVHVLTTDAAHAKGAGSAWAWQDSVEHADVVQLLDDLIDAQGTA